MSLICRIKLALTPETSFGVVLQERNCVTSIPPGEMRGCGIISSVESKTQKRTWINCL